MALLAASATCGICELELPEAREALRCGHEFCGDCLAMRRHVRRQDCWWCPVCSAPTGERFGACDDIADALMSM